MSFRAFLSTSTMRNLTESCIKKAPGWELFCWLDGCLGYLSDLEDRLVLAVTTNSVNALLSFIANAGDFIGLLVGIYYIGGNAHFGK